MGTGGGTISLQPGGRMLLILTRLVSPTPDAKRAPSKAFNSENPSAEPLTRKNLVGVLIIILATSQSRTFPFLPVPPFHKKTTLIHACPDPLVWNLSPNTN